MPLVNFFLKIFNNMGKCSRFAIKKDKIENDVYHYNLNIFFKVLYVLKDWEKYSHDANNYQIMDNFYFFFLSVSKCTCITFIMNTNQVFFFLRLRYFLKVN